MKYRIYKEKDPAYFLISLSGPFDVKVLENCYVDLLSGRDWKTGSNIIWDARQLKVEDVTLEDMPEIIAMTAKYSKKRGGGIAAWVVEDEQYFSKSEQYQLLSSGKVNYDFLIFRSLENAELFLMQKNQREGNC